MKATLSSSVDKLMKRAYMLFRGRLRGIRDAVCAFALPYWPIACGLSFFVVVAIAIYGVTCMHEKKDGGLTRIKPQKVYRQTLAEDMRISRHGLYGVDLVRCAACRIEKQKKGMLTFGGFNVLVMENLSIVIPPFEERRDDASEADETPREIAQRLGVSSEFLTMRGLPLKFSGLKIFGLEVSRFADGGKIERVFNARRAEAVRGGLSMRGCTIVRSHGREEAVGKAMLTKKGNKLYLAWSGGEMELM